MNNKYLAIVLSIVAVIVVVYQVFLRKPTDSIRQQLNQPQQTQPMFSTHGTSGTSGTGGGGGVTSGESDGNGTGPGTAVDRGTTPATTYNAQQTGDNGLIIDYNSELLLKRIEPELAVPYSKKELPTEFGQEIFSSGKFDDAMSSKSQEEQEVEFKLNAIIIDDTRQIAIINDKIVKPGDNVLGAEVVMIAKSKVLLKARGEEFVLSTNSRVKRVRLLGDRKE